MKLRLLTWESVCLFVRSSSRDPHECAHRLICTQNVEIREILNVSRVLPVETDRS